MDHFLSTKLVFSKPKTSVCTGLIAFSAIYWLKTTLNRLKRGKMSQNCFFRIHYKEFCVDSKKNTYICFGFWVRILGRVNFQGFSVKFYFRKIISKLDIINKCEISKFLGKSMFVFAKTIQIVRLSDFDVSIFQFTRLSEILIILKLNLLIFIKTLVYFIWVG